MHEDIRRFIKLLARESAKVINPYFNAPDLQVERKSDASPVTIADRRAEEVMRGLIQKEFPDHGIIGEEFGNENEDAEYVWVLDPIDGTISFTHGSPLFGTLIGLLKDEEPIYGAIHQSIIGQLAIGDNKETTLNDDPVKVRECDRLQDATLLTTDVINVSRYQSASGFEKLVDQVQVMRTWGDCFGYLMVATGKADIMVDPILNPWDLLPVIPVIRGAGGVVSSWTGGDAAKENSCVAASPQLHQMVVEILNR